AAVAPVAATEDPANDAGQRVGVRVAGASLAETVRLLHALDGGEPPIGIARLTLRKHPDDPARFDVTVEAAAPGVGPRCGGCSSSSRSSPAWRSRFPLTRWRAAWSHASSRRTRRG